MKITQILLALVPILSIYILFIGYPPFWFTSILIGVSLVGLALMLAEAWKRGLFNE